MRIRVIDKRFLAAMAASTGLVSQATLAGNDQKTKSPSKSKKEAPKVADIGVGKPAAPFEEQTMGGKTIRFPGDY